MGQKVVQMPGGPTEQEDAVIGAARQIRVDTDRGTVRVHDGTKQGGHELPNTELVRAMIAAAGGATSDVAEVSYFATQAEMSASTPRPNSIAVVGENGLEDIYVWKSGAGDGGTVTSAIDGNWHRLDSRTGFYVRLYRAGCINMQFGGAAPGANQDITAWLDNGVVKLWDGAAYQLATPVLFTRLLQKIGNYESSIILPNRLAAQLVAAANVNAIAETGWSKSSAADANAPAATVSPVFTYYTDANTGYQQFFVQNDANLGRYVRTKNAGTWSAWTYIEGITARLAATQTAIADANNAQDSGFYALDSTAANIPVAENGAILAMRRPSNQVMQTWHSHTADKIYARRLVAGVWQAWVQVYPADVTNATGTLPRVNVGISTISQAEAEAGTATTDRIWTAERVKQAIQIWWATSANYLANTANKVLTAAAVWAAAVPVNLGATLSGNLTINYSNGINFYGTATGNIVWNATSNVKTGQSGLIEITASGADRTVGVTASAVTFVGTLPTITNGTKCVFGYYGLQGGKTLMWVQGKGLTP